MRREELLKTDLVSDVLLLVAGVLIFVILLLILVVALTTLPGIPLKVSDSRLS